MAALPSDVGTGMIRIRMRKIGVVSSNDQDADVDAVTGKVIFTPSASMLRHLGQGLIFPSYPVIAYLDANGDADVQLMATNDAQITPVNWTYKVTFELDDEITITPFSIDVPEGSDRELSDLSPVVDNTGTYYIITGPPGPVGPASTVPGPTGPQGPAGAVDSAAVANVLGVTLVVSDTQPASPTLYGKPVVWITNGSPLTPVPVQPTAPAWNYSTFAVTPPTLVGVQYQFYDPTTSTWINLTSGVSTSLSGYTRPFVARVRAVALPGYVLLSNPEWSALFYTASAFVLWATEGFTGTPNSRLSSAPLGNPGRTWDMYAGGNATPAPAWLNAHSSEPSGIMIDSTGTKCTKNTEVAVGNTTQGNEYFYPAVANYMIQFDVTSYAIAHGRNIYNRFGTTLSSVVNGVSVDITINSTQAEIRFSAQTGVLAETFVYRTGVTEAMMLGTWKITWLNRYIRVDAPDGQTFGKDYSASTFVWGLYHNIGCVGTAPSTYPIFDNLQVFK